MLADDAESADELLRLCAVYRKLDDRRIDIDRQITALPTNDPTYETLWNELDVVLITLRGTVDRLAAMQTHSLAELRAKAGVLATVLRSAAGQSAAIIPSKVITTFALTLADDVARWPGEQ